MSRFEHTYCSQCGADLGPGEHGVSSCCDHGQCQAIARGDSCHCDRMQATIPADASPAVRKAMERFNKVMRDRAELKATRDCLDAMREWAGTPQGQQTIRAEIDAAAGVKGREPDAEFLRLLTLCETSYYTATRALDVPVVDVEQCRADHARARADLAAYVYGVQEGVPTWQQRAAERAAFERGVSAMRGVAVTVIRARHESGYACEPWTLVEAIRAAKEPTDPCGVQGTFNEQGSDHG